MSFFSFPTPSDHRKEWRRITHDFTEEAAEKYIDYLALQMNANRGKDNFSEDFIGILSISVLSAKDRYKFLFAPYYYCSSFRPILCRSQTWKIVLHCLSYLAIKYFLDSVEFKFIRKHNN